MDVFVVAIETDHFYLIGFECRDLLLCFHQDL